MASQSHRDIGVTHVPVTRDQEHAADLDLPDGPTCEESDLGLCSDVGKAMGVLVPCHRNGGWEWSTGYFSIGADRNQVSGCKTCSRSGTIR